MLAELLEPNRVDLSFDKKKRKQVIQRLVELAESSGAIREPATLVREILERDNQASTAVGDGVAIPHRLSPLVERQILVVLRTEKPAAFASPDGQPVRLCFLLLGPEDDVNGHLRAISRLARLLHDQTFRSALLEASDPERVVALLRDREGDG